MPGKRIAIIGAGPIGLEAAVYARGLGHDPLVLERGQIAQNVRDWAFVTLFSPWKMNATELGWRAAGLSGSSLRPHPDVCPSGSELADRYLLPLSRCRALDGAIRTDTQVLSIGREDLLKADQIGKATRKDSAFRILVRDRDGKERIERADVVLDCSGTYGQHRWAGRGGVPAPGEQALAYGPEKRLWYTIPDVLGRDRERFADRHTLLLGCGYSAATVLRDLELLVRRHSRTRVTWAIRRPGQAMRAIEGDPLTSRANLVKAALRLTDNPPGWLEFLPLAALEQLWPSDGRVTAALSVDASERSIQVDQIVAMVGYVPDASIHEQLQVHQCYATGGTMKLSAALLGEAGGDCLTSGATLGPEVLRNPEPMFFILGAKSYGTSSSFLIQAGHRQVRDVFQIIQDDPSLDLYERGT
jgi:hypothetical protein